MGRESNSYSGVMGEERREITMERRGGGSIQGSGNGSSKTYLAGKNSESGLEFPGQNKAQSRQFKHLRRKYLKKKIQKKKKEPKNLKQSQVSKRTRIKGGSKQSKNSTVQKKLGETSLVQGENRITERWCPMWNYHAVRVGGGWQMTGWIFLRKGDRRFIWRNVEGNTREVLFSRKRASCSLGSLRNLLGSLIAAKREGLPYSAKKGRR